MVDKEHDRSHDVVMAAAQLSALYRVNAAFSTTTGLVALAAPAPIAAALSVPAPAVRIVGGGLLAFASGLLTLASSDSATPTWGTAVAAADGIWVLATGAFLVRTSPPAAVTGLALGLAAPVAALAVLQNRAAAGHQTPRPRIVEVHQEIAGAADEVWAVMTDAELYGRLAPNLSRVSPFAVDDGGVPAKRRCWDVRGRHWDETCTRWEPGRSYSVDVHTQAADYPYPLAGLRGTWSLSPAAPGRSTVTMRFELRPRRGAGTAFAAAMAATGPAVMRRIINGWEKEVAARTPGTANTRNPPSAAPPITNELHSS